MSRLSSLLLSAVVTVPAVSALATEVVYTAAGTVSEPFGAGVDRVTVNMPAFAGANSFLEFSADNTGWAGEVYLNSGAIRVSSVAALGSVSAIHCASGTCVLVTAQFSVPTLNAAIIDKISVNVCEGEPWVALWVYGDGLKNDVDFSGQPYLWLSAPSKTKMGVSGWEDAGLTLNGTFTPNGDTYRFGYNYSAEQNRLRGLIVNSLSDIDAEHPRKIVIRKGSHVLGTGNAITGGIVLEQDACLGVNQAASWTNPSGLVANYLTLNTGCGLWVRTATMSIPDNVGVVFNGSTRLSISGDDPSVTKGVTFNGPVSGSGSLTITDSGAIHFASTNNTYAGDITWNWGIRNCWVEFGNGDNFSWPGTGTFKFANDSPGQTGTEKVLINSNADGEFGMTIVGDGRVYKRGTGTVTMLQSLARSGAAGQSMLEIEAGGLRRGTVETKDAEGWMQLDGAFDLGGLEQVNMYLPYGAGVVSNQVAGAAIRVRNAAVDNGKTFSGRIAAPLELKNTSPTVPWRLGDGATFDGGIDVQQGEIAVEPGATVHGTIAYGGGSVSYGAGAKVPDGVVVPEGRTAAFAGDGTAEFRSVTGAGYITLAEDGTWPKMDMSRFTGSILLNEATASSDAGTLPLFGNSIRLRGDWCADSGKWVVPSHHASQTTFTNVNGKTEVQLSNGVHTPPYDTPTGGILTKDLYPAVDSGWTLSFDWNLMPPQGSPGDRFIFYLTTSGANQDYSDWYLNNGYIKHFYGFQVENSSTKFSWYKECKVNADVNDGVCTDGVASCPALFNWKTVLTKTLHVEIAYDGEEKMVVTWTDGTTVFSTTNANAHAELSSITDFGSGARICLAYLGGGYYTAMRLSNLCLIPAGTAKPGLNGTLELNGGTNAFVCDGLPSATVAADLLVKGAAGFVRQGAHVDFTSGFWTFDFSNGAEPSVSFAEGIRLPERVTVTLAGAEADLPIRWTTIADLSAIANPPVFTLADTCAFPCALRMKDGCLQAKRQQGLMLLFR